MDIQFAVKTPAGSYVGFGRTKDAAIKDAKHWCVNTKICTVVQVEIREASQNNGSANSKE